MAVGLLQAMTLIASAWSKHVSRAARKLRRQGQGNVVPLGSANFRRNSSRRSKRGDSDEEQEKEEEMKVAAKEGVWRRTILMGEKCQPLDFPGVIYYDADGKRLSTPRSPMRSPLHALAMRSPIAGGDDCKGRYYKAETPYVTFMSTSST